MAFRFHYHSQKVIGSLGIGSILQENGPHPRHSMYMVHLPIDLPRFTMIIQQNVGKYMP